VTQARLAILFDLDGTLVDSAPDIAAALNVALGSAGLPPQSLMSVKRMVGGGARKLIERALTEAHATHLGADAILGEFLHAYRAAPARLTRPFEGCVECLHDLAGAGHALAVCTNKPDDLTEAILRDLGLAPHFSAVAASVPGVKLKPSPDLLRKALGDLNLPDLPAVMVGDSGADVGAARAAGVASVVMTHGYYTVPAADLGADAVVHHFSALKSVLEGLSVTR
jgi:phosphoglycolate phosphatase